MIVVRLVLIATMLTLVGSATRADDVGSADGAGLQVGDVLGPDNWQKAEGLLPPEILVHYKNGDYINPIVDWPEDFYNWPPDFLAGSKSNEGSFTTSPEGDILDKATGKQPQFIIGFPFPTIDPADPAAGVKILWNYFYRTWYFGTLSAQSQLNWINPRGLERRSDVEVKFMYYDGVPEQERLPNPQNFISQFITAVVGPADLNGTAALTWRYRDPGKRDSSWSYVPALRRVRAVSPANRSDGFLGSDISQDDGPFFDGKPEDFTWTLKGEKEQLRLVDPLNLRGSAENVWLPGGGWRAIWPDLPFIGYMDKDWTGIAWAPRSAALAKRPFWVIEGVPKDKYYLYGKLELYIDKIAFQGAWNRKFGWKGELLTTLQVMAYNPQKLTRPDGTIDYVQGSNMAFQTGESIKANRATAAGIKSNPKSGFDARITFDPSLFDMNTLNRWGK